MDKRYLILLIILVNSTLYGQQIPEWSSFYDIGFIWNPALTAQHDYWEISATNRKEWLGFSQAPQYSNLAFQIPLRNKDYDLKSGVGFYLDSDRVGPYTKLNLGVSYSYEIHLGFTSTDALSIGLSGQLQQQRLSTNEFVAFDDLSNELNPGDINSTYFPDISFGLNYISKNEYLNFEDNYFYVGISANRLIPNNNMVNIFGKLSSNLHGTFSGGFRNYLKKNKNIYLEPNILISYSRTNHINVMLNVRVEDQRYFWVSGGLVSNHEIFGQIGVILNEDSFLENILNDGILRIGIKADYKLSKFSSIGGLGSEIYLAYRYRFE